MFRDMTTYEHVPAPAYVATRLGIGEGDPVVYHERLNLLDGRPLTLRAGWMTEAIGLQLAQLNEVHAPMLDIINRELGLDVGTVELKIEASIADRVDGRRAGRGGGHTYDHDRAIVPRPGRHPRGAELLPDSDRPGLPQHCAAPRIRRAGTGRPSAASLLTVHGAHVAKRHRRQKCDVVLPSRRW
jgi:hypothetical protein